MVEREWEGKKRDRRVAEFVEKDWDTDWIGRIKNNNTRSVPTFFMIRAFKGIACLPPLLSSLPFLCG